MYTFTQIPIYNYILIYYRERLIKQKAILDDKLGLQQMNKIGLMDDILSLEDMKCEHNGSNQSDTITRLVCRNSYLFIKLFINYCALFRCRYKIY